LPGLLQGVHDLTLVAMMTQKLRRFASHEPTLMGGGQLTLEESLSITTGRCNLAIATHARKMHKKISI